MITLPMFRPTKLHHQLLILRKINQDPKASMRGIGRAVGISAALACGYVGELMRKQLVISEGENRGTRYSLSPRGELILADLENQLDDDLRALAAAARDRRRRR